MLNKSIYRCFLCGLFILQLNCESQTYFIFDKGANNYLRNFILEKKSQILHKTVSDLLEDYKNTELVFFNIIKDSTDFNFNEGLYSVKFSSLKEPSIIFVASSKGKKCYYINENLNLKELYTNILNFLKEKKMDNKKKLEILSRLNLEMYNSINLGIYNCYD